MITREDAKKLLPIIKAYSEGKEIQLFNGKEWINMERPFFNSDPNCYRIKPEQKYRPFKSVEECWEEMQKHQPFGWVKFKDSPLIYQVLEFYKDIDFEHRFNYFTFADGTPYGIEDEE